MLLLVSVDSSTYGTMQINIDTTNISSVSQGIHNFSNKKIDTAFIGVRYVARALSPFYLV